MQSHENNSKKLTDAAKTACGGILKEANGYPSALYHGRRIYFCTQACFQVFEQQPDAFMAGEIEHPED